MFNVQHKPKRAATTGTGEHTRELILRTALDLFRRGGFEVTTMRDIACAAKVATGAAYYYFPSKEAIVAAYYDQVQRLHGEKVREELKGKSGLRERLAAVMHSKLEISFGLRERHAVAAGSQRFYFSGCDCRYQRQRRTAATSAIGAVAGPSGHDPVLPLRRIRRAVQNAQIGGWCARPACAVCRVGKFRARSALRPAFSN